MIVFKKLQQAKKMIKQMVISWAIIILKTIIAKDLSKQQVLNADSKAIQKLNFTGNLNRAEGEKMPFIIEKAKERVLDFSQGTVKIF